MAQTTFNEVPTSNLKNLSQTTHIKFKQPNIKLGWQWQKQAPN